MRLKCIYMYLQFFYIATLKTFHTAQRKIKCYVKYLTVLKHLIYIHYNRCYDVSSSIIR